MSFIANFKVKKTSYNSSVGSLKNGKNRTFQKSIAQCAFVTASMGTWPIFHAGQENMQCMTLHGQGKSPWGQMDSEGTQRLVAFIVRVHPLSS